MRSLITSTPPLHAQTHAAPLIHQQALVAKDKRQRDTTERATVMTSNALVIDINTTREDFVFSNIR